MAGGIGSARALVSRSREQTRLEGPGPVLLKTLLARLGLQTSLTGPQGEPAPGKVTLAWMDPESLELWVTLPGSGEWVPLGKGWNAVEALLTQLKPQGIYPGTPKPKVRPRVLPKDPRLWQF